MADETTFTNPQPTDISTLSDEPTPAPEAAETPAAEAAPAEASAPAPSPEAEEYELELPGGVKEKFNRERLLQEAAYGAAGRKALERARALQEQADSRARRLKENPEEALLSEMGQEELDKLLVGYANRRIAEEEEERANPGASARRKAEAELKRREEAVGKSESAQKEAAFQAEVKKEGTRFDEELPLAFKARNLPVHPALVMRVATRMKEGLAHGRPIPVENAVRVVESELKSEVRAVLGALSPEKLHDFLGEELDAALATRRLSAVRASPNGAGPARASGPPSPGGGQKQRPPMSLREWEEAREKARAELTD